MNHEHAFDYICVKPAPEDERGRWWALEEHCECGARIVAFVPEVTASDEAP